MWRYSQAAFFRGFFLLAFVVLRKNFRLDRLTSFRGAACAPAHRNVVLLFYSNAAYPNRDMAFLWFVALSVPIGQLCKHVNNRSTEQKPECKKTKKKEEATIWKPISFFFSFIALYVRGSSGLGKQPQYEEARGHIRLNFCFWRQEHAL